MKKFILAATSVAVIAGGAFYALAERTEDGKKDPHGKKHMLERLDANKDGKVTKDEFVADAEKRFSEIDADKDGNVTEEEMRAHHKAKREEFGQMREGMKEEMAARRDKHFEEMDANGDGSISKEEMDAFHESRKGGRGSKHDAPEAEGAE